MTPTTLLQFAQVNDAAAATTKKLQKQAILAEYFETLEEQDLRLAVRYAAGRPFAATDVRALNVGGALVSQVVLGLLKMDPGAFHDLAVRSGEIGEALSKAWPENAREVGMWGVGAVANAAGENPQLIAEIDPPHSLHSHLPTASLLLSDLARGFDELAATGAWERKAAVLHGLFARCRTGREAAYLAKIIFGDLRTGVQEGVLQAAVALAFGKTTAEVQRCQLLVGDLDEVAALAKIDALGSAAFRLFHPILPMLATPQETAEVAAGTMAGRTFFAEDKLDGIRAQIHKSGNGPAARVAVYTRDLGRVDASFPDVAEAVSRLPGEFLLDGEIVPYRDGQVLPFAHIQKRLGRKVLTPKVLKENPCTFIAFDILYREGQLLMDCPLRVRKERLEELLNAGSGTPKKVSKSSKDSEPSIPFSAPHSSFSISSVPVATAEQITAAFEAARGRRNEGIVLKDPESPYSPGRRGQLWLKLKTHLPTFDCVVTAAETGHGKRRNWLSDYTFAVWDHDPAEPGAALVNIGKAYSGLTEEEIIQLTELFTKLTLNQAGRVRRVEPKVVLEIACDQIQASDRHAGGYALRFPRIKRIRWDKRPEDADRLARIVELYQSTPNFARPGAGAAGATQAEPAAPAPREPSLFD